MGEIEACKVACSDYDAAQPTTPAPVVQPTAPATNSPSTGKPNSLTCKLGCNKCGYNWYEHQWNNGNPSWYFKNLECGCCQGTKEEIEVCKVACSDYDAAQPTTLARVVKQLTRLPSTVPSI